MAYEIHHPEEVKYHDSGASLSYGHSRLAEIAGDPKHIPLGIATSLEHRDVIALAGDLGHSGAGAILTDRLMQELAARSDLPQKLPDIVYGASTPVKRFQSALKNAIQMLIGPDMVRKVDTMGIEVSLAGTLRKLLGSGGILTGAKVSSFQPFGLLHELSRPRTFALVEDLNNPLDPITTVVPIAGKSRAELMLMEATNRLAGESQLIAGQIFIARTSGLVQTGAIQMHICTINPSG